MSVACASNEWRGEGQAICAIDLWAGDPPYASMTQIEERIAHLTRTVEDLSDVIARQDREIMRLTRTVERLVAREAERETAADGGIVLRDERPPHY